MNEKQKIYRWWLIQFVFRINFWKTNFQGFYWKLFQSEVTNCFQWLVTYSIFLHWDFFLIICASISYYFHSSNREHLHMNWVLITFSPPTCIFVIDSCSCCYLRPKSLIHLSSLDSHLIRHVGVLRFFTFSHLRLAKLATIHFSLIYNFSLHFPSWTLKQ